MACNSLSLFSPNYFIPISTKPPAKHLFSSHTYLPCNFSQYYNSKREFPLPSVASIPYQPINVDYLEEEFSGHGVTFEGIGDNCVAKMGLENGSTVNLMLPSGLISSYKAPMWHGGKVELLHTSVSEDENGGAVIQGGVSLALNCSSDGDDEVSWSPCNWALRNIRGDAQESIQVELIDRDSENKIEVKYIVTLKKDMLSSELVVSNSNSSSLLQLTGSIVSHLVVSTPDATYALGLEGSDFFNRSPLLTNFALVPPDFGQKNEFGLGQFLGQMTLKGLSSGWGARNQNTADDAESSPRESEEEMEGEEDDNYKHLKQQMSRIYTSAPRYFTIIDRGKRNSVGVGREGFDELYMFSPGSRHEYYSTYSYVCVGQSALLKPIILGPEEEWRGLQHLHNPNL
ncbi:protein NDH-DEPENDENT CYCLIC ELECTRON FLOW 5 [Quercus robur]|uniref:protein NDH-DEPENDENT CYCLIC ELECTRON FLOW 5 n=1 Tax=Quercus robur TaxID=38942 RepID=UPI0021626A8A|nr:protein NDH-DEPENDENT CYCLIC ELECTRON FLOW 5 [Quercus robur]